MGMKTIGRFVFDSSTVEEVAAGNIIPLTTSTVSTNSLSNDNGVITVNAPGAYLICVNITYEALGDTVETQLMRNGSAISGAHAINATTTDDYASQAFQTVITVSPNQFATLTIDALVEANVRIANVIVLKVA